MGSGGKLCAANSPLQHKHPAPNINVISFTPTNTTIKNIVPVAPERTGVPEPAPLLMEMSAKELPLLKPAEDVAVGFRMFVFPEIVTKALVLF